MSESQKSCALDLTTAALPSGPYPGLRAFSGKEWPIFFGREVMTLDVMHRLAKRHLVTVHGESGCGKSSLIRAGVLPALEQDHSRADGSWRICIAQPGDSPLRNLAEALASLDGQATNESIREFRRAFLDRPRTIDRLLKLLEFSDENSICLLIDQFEELFEHAQRNDSVDADYIVSFLAALINKQPPGFFVILTMRTEYLGRCAQYAGFAEIVNDTQYLLPYMDRRAILRAIQAPAKLFGGSVDDKLAITLAAEASRGQDRLPLLQHGLNRMWVRKRKASAPVHLSMEDYECDGALTAQLSRHADEILADATGGNPKKELIVERVFRALIDRNAEGLSIRRPQAYKDLLKAAGTSNKILQPILARFRAEGSCFLRPYGDEPLKPNDQVDVSHEAFIRNWDRISERRTGWFDKETEDSLIWHSLRIQTEAYKGNSAMLLSPAVAEDRSRWMAGRSAVWARRYGGDWEAAVRLTEASRDFEAETWARRGGKPRDVHIPFEMLEDDSIVENDFDPSWSHTVIEYERQRKILRHRKRLIECVKGGHLTPAASSVRALRELGYDQLLDYADRGDGVYLLPSAFWAALTGDDRTDKALRIDAITKNSKTDESVFDDDEGKRQLKRTTSRNVTVLAWAAFAGRLALVKKLIEHFGVDTNQRDFDGNTILHAAAVGGDLNTVQYLVETCKLEVTSTTYSGSPSIIWAIQGKHHDVVKYLLANGQGIHFLADESWNALTEAARADDLPYFLKLVEQEKFDLAHTTKFGQTLLHIACGSDRADTSQVAHYLVTNRAVDLTAQTAYGSTPLVEATTRGKLSAVLVLIAAARSQGIGLDAFLDARDESGLTPLHTAAFLGHNKVVQALLEAGAKPDITDNIGNPAIIGAASSGHNNIVELLIRHNASTDLYVDWGALHFAAHGGNLEMLEIIRAARAEINWNMREKRVGWTPLMIACREGRLDCVTFLLTKIADVDASLKGSNGLDALAIIRNALKATRQSNDERQLRRARIFEQIEERLLSYAKQRGGANTTSMIDPEVFVPYQNPGPVENLAMTSDLAQAARDGEAGTVEEILKWSYVSSEGFGQAIRAAVQTGRLEVLNLLLDAGHGRVSLDALSRCAEEAAGRGRIDCAKALIAAGAAEPPTWSRPQVSAAAWFMQFNQLVGEQESSLKARLQEKKALHIGEQDDWRLKSAPLSFFPGCQLVAVEHLALPGQNEQFVILDASNNITLLDWTNVPIYRLADKYLDLSTEDKQREYILFFFNFVRGVLGRFHIVERVDQIPWAEDAGAEERKNAEELLRPLSAIKEEGGDDRLVHGATMIFKNALFFSKIVTATKATKIRIEDNEAEDFTPGQHAMFDEELLLEELSIIVSPPPTVFG